MWSSSEKIFFLLRFIILITENAAFGKFNQEPEPYNLERVKSPTLEVLMRLPSGSHNMNFDRIKESEKSEKPIRKGIVDSRTYEISRWTKSEPNETFEREKREVNEAGNENPVPEQLVSSLTEAQAASKYSDQEGIPSAADALRRPPFPAFSSKQFDELDFSDLSHQRRRRNDSADGREDNSQRDKRTFVDGGGGDSGEATSSTPYWKRKKDNPQFITGRGSTPKGSDYSPPQHRSVENSRESHSMKNLETPVQGNEVGRSNQDNYYSSTNRRTFSRQSDATPPSTPKSVYDTLDYSNNKRNQDIGRPYREGNHREGRFTTHENYKTRQFAYNYPTQERSYYAIPSAPIPSEIVGRGVEYYHRTFDPANSRIVYYANMPENGRPFDYRNSDPESPINRNFYVQRSVPYEANYMNYVPPYDYGFYNGNGMPRPMDYMRSGRSSFQVYSYPYQERSKYQRDPRFLGYDKENQIHDNVRNKTYIIYDADDARFARPQYPSDNGHRLGLSPAFGFGSSQTPHEGFRRFSQSSGSDYFSSVDYPLRTQPYSPRYSGSTWIYGQNQGFQTNSKWHATPNTNSNFRALNSPEVQLPLTTVVNRYSPSRDSDKINKKA